MEGGTTVTPRKGGGTQVRKRTGKWSARKRAKFLAVLGETSNVRLAARTVKITATAAYQLRRRDAGFAQAWAAAIETGYSQLETLLLQKAISSLTGARDEEEDEQEQGQGKGAAIKLSDRTILSLLAYHRQSVRSYRERTGGEPVAEDSDAVRARLEARLAEIRGRLEQEA